MAENRPQIGERERRIGRATNNIVARAPWLWPLLRGRVRSAFDGMAQGWDERTSAGSAEYLTPLATAVLHAKPAPERALDIGCGTGDGALFLSREFPRASVRGIDISEEMIRLAERKVGLDPDGRIAFKVADASDMPYEDDSFDLVAQVNVPPFFAEMARVLRPGGYAIVTASWGDETPFYTPAAVLERGFQKHGLQTVDSGEAGAGTYFVARRPTA
jgi:ubiquinone/menaquinone biosynthesis C-methylase UbiE